MEFKKIDFEKEKFSQLTTEKEKINFLTKFTLDLINTVEINYKTLLPEEIDDLFFNVITFTEKNDYKRNSTSEEIVNLTNFVKLDYMRDATKNENETLMEYFIRKRPDLLLRPIRDLLEFRVFQPENGGLIYVKNKIGYKVFLEYKRAINERIKKETQSTQITNEISTIKNKYEFLLKLCDIAKKTDSEILNPEILDLDIESFTDDFEKECFENFSNNENKNSELHLYLTKLQILNTFWKYNSDVYEQSEDTLNNKILRHCANLFECCFGEFEFVCFTFNIDLDKYCHDINYFLNTNNIPRGICAVAPFIDEKQNTTENIKDKTNSDKITDLAKIVFDYDLEKLDLLKYIAENFKGKRINFTDLTKFNQIYYFFHNINPVPQLQYKQLIYELYGFEYDNREIKGKTEKHQISINKLSQEFKQK